MPTQNKIAQSFAIGEQSKTLIISWTYEGKPRKKIYKLLTENTTVVREYLQAYVTANTPLLTAVKKMKENNKAQDLDDLFGDM